jgi:mono/diheme cytochrome c family protein
MVSVRLITFRICAVAFTISGLRLLAAEPNAAGIDFFERKVRPLFAENCFSCHGEEKQKAKLRLDSPAAIRAGSESGVILVPGKPDESKIILAVSYKDEDLKMPPKTRLSERQVADLIEWVKLGAPMPPSEAAAVAAPAKKEFQITDKDRAHWAFQPIERPRAPKVSGRRSQDTNPIDAFIFARLKAKGLAPNPPATKREMIRRAYYDLTGLPPAPSDVETFLSDKSPQAWESLIDSLLASPRYGEKWGRHWLDLVRYAESNSYERDNPKPHPWRYRDYVIRSFNEDKPYDRFIREQLAGDEFPSANDDAIIATGFYRLGIWDDEPADKDLARYDGLDDIVTTTGQVFLGLTVDCARCHNHKVDPIPQSDYYRLLAFFQNVNAYENSGPKVEVPLPSNSSEKALAVTEAGGKPPATFVLLRGNPHVKGDQVEPGFLQVLGAPEPNLVQSATNAKTSGHRTVLANWIASSENPLTARVMVNRIWQYHFGRGIVRSPNNLGLQGDAPTHPELLDWLASEFIAQGWSMKSMHRLIMTSQAYRMSSGGRADALKADPANDLFWRFDMRRLTAEEIRDSILAINGSLNLKMFGPSIYVEIPKEVLAGQSRPGQNWGKSPPEEQARRSIYIHVKRSLLTPILESFDLAETDRSTPVRFSTVQPTQALSLLNSEFLNRQAGVFAARLRKEAGDDLQKQIRLGLYLVTSREPTSAEIKRGLRLVESLKVEEQATEEVALKYFCLMALNLNEMVYLD